MEKTSTQTSQLMTKDSSTNSYHKYAWRYLWGENGGISKHNLKRHKINFCSLECEWDNPNTLGLISREMRGNERESLEVLGHCFRVAKSALGLVRAAIYKPKPECQVSKNSGISRTDRNRSIGSLKYPTSRPVWATSRPVLSEPWFSKWNDVRF